MPRILVIDDDLVFNRMLVRLLKHHEYEVIAAADGKEGIEALRQEGADLVITDIYMPGQDGLETIMQLREDFPEVGLIAMSGGSVRLKLDALELARKLGRCRTLQKPFEEEELVAAVEAALAGEERAHEGGEADGQDESVASQG